MKKTNTLGIVLSALMFITTFLPWYSVEAGSMSASIGGITTLMGFVAFLVAVLALVFVLMKKKLATIFGIVAILVGILSLVFNAAIFGPMAEAVNQTIKPTQWSKYLSFGGALFAVLSIVFTIITIKFNKSNNN
jgi:hypothetical protein